jgi:hypothetical protein
MPYSAKWSFEKAPKEVYEGCKTSILSMQKNPCIWTLVNASVRRNNEM